MKFKKGNSGNPAGKPKGAKDKRTELRALFQPHAKDLIDKAVTLALKGDPAALRLCLERLVSPIKASTEPFKADVLLTGTLSERGERLIQAMASGEIGPDEGAALIGALQAQCRIVELSDLEARLTALENQKGSQK